MLAVKLIQLLKMKGLAQQATADALVAILNENKVSDKDAGFFESLYQQIEERGVFPNEKEKFILNSLPHIGLCQNALVAYQCREGFGFLNSVLALSMETAEFPVDFFSDYTLSQRGRTTQGVVLFKNQMQALTDKSKKIATKPDVSEVQAGFSIPRVFNLHSQLADRALQNGNQLQIEINSDEASIFSNKKYKEIQKLAVSQQQEYCLQVEETYKLRELGQQLA